MDQTIKQFRLNLCQQHYYVAVVSERKKIISEDFFLKKSQ